MDSLYIQHTADPVASNRFDELSRSQQIIIIYEEPYKVNLEDLDIKESGKKYSSLVNQFNQFFNDVGNLRCVVFDKKKQIICTWLEQVRKKTPIRLYSLTIKPTGPVCGPF